METAWSETQGVSWHTPMDGPNALKHFALRRLTGRNVRTPLFRKNPESRDSASRRPNGWFPLSDHVVHHVHILGTKYFYLVPNPGPHSPTPLLIVSTQTATLIQKSLTLGKLRNGPHRWNYLENCHPTHSQQSYTWKFDKLVANAPLPNHPLTVRTRRNLPVRDCDGGRVWGFLHNLCDLTDNPHAKNRFVSLPNRTDLHNVTHPQLRLLPCWKPV